MTDMLRGSYGSTGVNFGVESCAKVAAKPDVCGLSPSVCGEPGSFTSCTPGNTSATAWSSWRCACAAGFYFDAATKKCQRTCASGYYWDANLKQCRADLCAASPSPCGVMEAFSSCAATPSAPYYTCKCRPGFNFTGATCERISDTAGGICATQPCGDASASSRCTPVTSASGAPSYVCACNTPAYLFDGTLGTCAANPCSRTPSVCGAAGAFTSCTPLSSTDWACTCAAGYFFNATTRMCQAGSCTSYPNPCGALGTYRSCDTLGASDFNCTCSRRYFFYSAAKTCVRNLCAPTNPCGNGSVCSPLTGTTYTCSCPPGQAFDQIAKRCIVDTTPPVLSTPASVISEASGPDGAVVLFTARAYDVQSGATTPTTNVSCSIDGYPTVSSFPVTVATPAPPVFSPAPAALSVRANVPLGAVVNFTVAASDALSGPPVVECTPPSGFTFPYGATTVTCVATDGVGLQASASFSVTVGDPCGSVPSPCGAAGAFTSCTPVGDFDFACQCASGYIADSTGACSSDSQLATPIQLATNASLCLDASETGQLSQRPCAKASSQSFTFQPTGSAAYAICSAAYATARCLTVATSGGSVALADLDPNGAPGQRFYLRPAAGAAGFMLVPVQRPTKCLAVAGVEAAALLAVADCARAGSPAPAEQLFLLPVNASDISSGNLVLPYVLSFASNAIVMDPNGEPNRESVDNFKALFKEAVAAEWSTEAASLSDAAINILTGSVNGEPVDFGDAVEYRHHRLLRTVRNLLHLNSHSAHHPHHLNLHHARHARHHPHNHHGHRELQQLDELQQEAPPSDTESDSPVLPVTLGFTVTWPLAANPPDESLLADSLSAQVSAYVDDVKPVIAAEATSVYVAGSGAGTVVTLPTVTASDNFYVATPVYCTPPSGSVVCKAVDGSGNYATLGIEVTVGQANACASDPCAAGGVVGTTCTVHSGGAYTCNCPKGALAAADPARNRGKLTCYDASLIQEACAIGNAADKAATPTGLCVAAAAALTKPGRR
ncbi:hypothetical protein GPECTOR_111g243 [Gonium pectorale]|uniref:HYR domain-containing protein n=1 Tax=Gonium pectorale TaxID=33097 RepID=A0A150G0R8_GONPE|nr:hypothetical protein GPECTOR_111g243 [Gonium pectorale]|eukprot:KXZ42910.1 hypothetical protein GPECTOR_111g243 [Gonium pectorale]